MDDNEQKSGVDATGDADAKNKAALWAWQAKLLPVLIGTLFALGIIFFAGAFWNYATLTAQLNAIDAPLEPTIQAMTEQKVSQDFQETYARIALEDRVMRNRYRINTAAIESRTWTRLMGFVTGMAMVLTGCFFILAKLEANYEASGKVPASEGSLKTNSPGLVLATGGALLICISLYIKGDVQDSDASVYLPRLVEYVAPASAAASVPSSPAPKETAPSHP